MKAIVTLKYPYSMIHDPRRKKTGECPVSIFCTDKTGQHHSYLEEGKDLEEIITNAEKKKIHITRIEVVKE